MLGVQRTGLILPQQRCAHSGAETFRITEAIVSFPWERLPSPPVWEGGCRLPTLTAASTSAAASAHPDLPCHLSGPLLLPEVGSDDRQPASPDPVSD